MENFTPGSAIPGGLLIGISAGYLLLASGRISGISGMLEGMCPPYGRDFGLRAMYLIGLLAAPFAVSEIAPSFVPEVKFQLPIILIPVAGLLVGFGARLANGCTSGHGICGLPRFSRRSFAATVTFFSVAILTVVATRAIDRAFGS